MILVEANCVVYGAADGPSGVLLAENRLPDVIVTELVVPQLDGFGILRTLKANELLSHTPVIAVTGLLDANTRDRAHNAGFTDVLAKPVELVALLQAVREVVSKTPPDRRVRRRLRRSLLTLRRLGAHLASDPLAQARIRRLIDRLQVAVLAFDDTGRYVAASPAVSSLTGYSRTQILARSIFQVPLVNPPTDMQQRWGEFLTAQHCTASGTLTDADGATIELHAAFVTVLPGLHAAAIAPIPVEPTM
jgi:PAS domain S-box-containing protein